MTRKVKQNLLLCGMAMLLALVAAFCITLTAVSQSRIERREQESYYHAKEQEMVQKTREYLNKAGFTNSGVMLTRVVDAEGARDYTITVHHHRINKLDPESREALARELKEFDFASEECSFSYKFLTLN